MTGNYKICENGSSRACPKVDEHVHAMLYVYEYMKPLQSQGSSRIDNTRPLPL